MTLLITINTCGGIISLKMGKEKRNKTEEIRGG
jgi:hypothetical protein